MPLEKRLCMHCQRNVATIKIVRLENGTATERFLCPQCAATESPYQKKATPQLEEILTSILGVESTEAATSVDPSEQTCSHCGLPFSSYRESLILGCSECYKSFEKALLNDLQRFHGTTRYTGRAPHGRTEQVRPTRDAAELKRRLADAVRAEDFRLAARLRDQLREIEAREIARVESNLPVTDN